MSEGVVAWFTGLSGAGKTTIARAAADLLVSNGLSVEIVDGDELRRTRARHLGFSAENIMESNDLAVQVCSELRRSCDVVLVPRISPFRRARQIARQALGKGFIEVYVKASIETVAERDPKGLYQRAREAGGDMPIGMPGGLPFDEPSSPDLILDTETWDQRVLAETLAAYVKEQIGQRQVRS